jgi:glycosyltransferase involved in cell wall biosynthesis
MHKISVIIPTYNSEKFLDRAIVSVLNQVGVGMRFELEILVCDDKSTDGTLDIALKYINRGAWLRILQNNKNSRGPNWGRNKGIKNATGDLLAFLDHDDEWLPEKTLHQIRLMKKYDQDFAYSGPIHKNTVASIQPDSDIYQSLMTWTNRKAGAYMGSILMKNENVPLFDDYQLEYKWLLDVTKDRRCIRTTPMVIRYAHDNNLSQKEQYRLAAHEQLRKLLGDNAIRRETGTLARFYYKLGKYKESRFFFTQSNPTVKNYAYYFTSFYPKLALWVVKRYNVFG